MEPVVKSIELPNRVKLNYVEQGDASGIPMILLHGGTDSWHSFENVLPYLPDSIHAFALSQRGHGDSERPETGYYPRDFAEDVVSFIETLDLGSVVVVGHSMGSYNALRLAIDHPECLLGLALAGASANFYKNPVLVEFFQTDVLYLTDPIDYSFARAFQESTLAHPIPQTFLETAVQESLKVPARVWKAAFEGFMTYEFADELGKIKAPTLFIWGTRDLLCSRQDQETLLTKIPGSQLIVYEDAGHALHWEEPERFAIDVTTFTQSLLSEREVSIIPDIIF